MDTPNHSYRGNTMDTATLDRLPVKARQQDAARTPPPLRLPRYLLAHLAKPIQDLDDANRLVAQIRMAQWRGLL